MATRMQQRRGTAAQWTAANPILAAGEIGFETDTSKFKMGNGSSTWSALQYFANAAELAAIVDGAPDLLNTLNELAASIGDDPAFFTTIGQNLQTHINDSTQIHGIADTAALALQSHVNTAATDAASALSTHASDTTLVHGIQDMTALALKSEVNTAASDASGALSTHSSDTTGIHGIADTSLLATTADITTHNSDTTLVHGIADTSLLATTANVQTAAQDAAGALSTHAADTTLVHGIADTSLLATTGDISTHNSDTTNVHGIADTSALATLTNVSDHSADTTNIHGILDTSVLVTQTDLTNAIDGATVDQSAQAGTGLDWDTVNNQYNIDSTIATKQYADDAVSTHQSDTTSVHGIADTADLATKTYADSAVSTHNSDTTNVHGIADTSLLATTADVAAVTKTSLGLGSVDNTADTAKPVSTAQSTAIATAKAEAIADATAQVNALLTGAPAALNTLDELAAALGDDANFASSVTTSLGLKVDSLTPISQKTASYTLSSLTERDDLIEMGSATGVTLTIPTDATLNFPIGTSIDILQTGAGQVTIAPVSGTVTVNATPGLKLRTTWSSATLFKRAANTWVVFGDLTA